MTTASVSLPRVRPMRTDRTRSDVARERSLARRATRANRTPLALDLDRLADDLHAEWSVAR